MVKNLYANTAGPWVQSLVREDPTCFGAIKPQLLGPHSRACAPQQEKPHSERPLNHPWREREAPAAASRESLCAATKTQRNQNNFLIKIVGCSMEVE